MERELKMVLQTGPSTLRMGRGRGHPPPTLGCSVDIIMNPQIAQAIATSRDSDETLDIAIGRVGTRNRSELKWFESLHLSVCTGIHATCN